MEEDVRSDAPPRLGFTRRDWWLGVLAIAVLVAFGWGHFWATHGQRNPQSLGEVLHWVVGL